MSKRDLFTYKAYVERVVDGDTLRVQIDLGFGQWPRQYLRLRGIDTPERNTPEGKIAKAFVEKELRGVSHLIIKSSHTDKYDRYLADVFYKENLYLNRRLLDHGHAKRMA